MNLQKLVPLLILSALYLVDVESAINLSFTPCLSLLTNIKQNKLTLKSLQDKLDKLEKSSNINIEVRKGGMPSLLLLSTILTYVNKIPLLDKVITYIGKRYAKYTWLQLLIYLRKCFIVFNAIIGVITVFKITGYSSDNWIAGLYGLGSMGKERILK